MSLTTLILATHPDLSSSYCFTTFKQLGRDLFKGEQYTFQSSVGNSFYNFGATVPTVENQLFPWFRTGSSQDGWYYYSGGSWIMAHPVPPLSEERRFWVGTEAGAWAYDGGDGVDPAVTTPTSVTGAMWEVDHLFDAKFPIGPGTLPGYQATPIPTVIPVATNGGTEGLALTITKPMLPAHSHPIGTEAAGADETQPAEDGQLRVGGGTLHWELNNGAHVGHTREVGSGQVIDIPNLPPYRAAYIIARTSREFYTV